LRLWWSEYVARIVTTWNAYKNVACHICQKMFTQGRPRMRCGFNIKIVLKYVVYEAECGWKSNKTKWHDKEVWNSRIWINLGFWYFWNISCHLLLTLLNGYMSFGKRWGLVQTWQVAVWQTWILYGEVLIYVIVFACKCWTYFWHKRCGNNFMIT
jgi:hypothetical protein